MVSFNLFYTSFSVFQRLSHLFHTSFAPLSHLFQPLGDLAETSFVCLSDLFQPLLYLFHTSFSLFQCLLCVF